MSTAPPEERSATWVDICAASDVVADRGVAAAVNGSQAAVFVLGDGRVFAIANRDPWSGANVMARGIVGSAGERAVVASPMYKQHLDLATGTGIEQPEVSVRTWPARIRGGRIEVACP